MSDKRFPPSVQRLKKARRDGKTVKSRMVVVSAGWIALLAFFIATHPWVRVGTLIQWFKFKVLSPGATLKYSLLITGALLIVSIGCVSMASVLLSVLQTRGLIATKKILPDLTRLQPVGYVKRLRESGVDAAIGVVRVSVLVIALAPLLVAYVMNASVLFRASEEWVIPGVVSYLKSAAVRTIGIMVVLGGCAYCCLWWRFIREHRMSFEEIKEEHKQSEGDPHLRAARRHEHQALAMAEIEKRVRNSKVLVIRRRPSALM